MVCPPVRGDNPPALANGLSYVQVDKQGITILCHLHQCTLHITSYFMLKLVKVVKSAKSSYISYLTQCFLLCVVGNEAFLFQVRPWSQRSNSNILKIIILCDM